MAINDIYTLPNISRNMVQMQDLLQAEQKEISALQEIIVATEKELHLYSCFDLLTRYETIFGIIPNETLSLFERQTNLNLKLNARSNTTIQTIKDLIFTILGCSCELIEHYYEYRMFLNIHFPEHQNTNDVYKVLEQIELIKPAHIGYLIAIVIEAIILQNQNQLLFKQFSLRYRENNFLLSNVFLNGTHEMNGSFLLTYFTKQLQFHHFQMRMKQQTANENTLSMTNVQKAFLNGQMYLNGKYQLNTNIQNKEIL